jgi:hypothetical protein
VVSVGLKVFPAARKAIVEALAIMEELGLQHGEQYSGMLLDLGFLDHAQERYQEALVIFDKAKAVLVRHKEGHDYGALLSDMAVCHRELQQWSEAVVLQGCGAMPATCTATTILIARPRCTTSSFCSPASSSTRRPSRDWRRHLPSARGCLVTSTNALLDRQAARRGPSARHAI